mmetsp:Transcript_5003/g.12579  ORF Transcript_5003/g.12579 Transcript_5003/m.12579 type:complete len:1065 (-) Transcript_5003:142-3336(-)|eukprot:CAMPEP_0178982830 /NCGR_PEP_ID=MMETSP0795-20121207/715_1 /TAXON_ID=88552 /ORGANISM="Amoebophrya sp., Strain Ameob2" /LENGTH=1064 /DNA_ID=CAMNT_0020673521 /DNA_START=53 /DNA_END=3247 /DNA_ORIENTATION=+
MEEIFVEEDCEVDPERWFADFPGGTGVGSDLFVATSSEEDHAGRPLPPCFTSLPDELLLRIALYCPASLSRLACCCRFWRRCARRYGHLVHRAYASPLEALSVQRFMRRHGFNVSHHERLVWQLFQRRETLWMSPDLPRFLWRKGSALTRRGRAVLGAGSSNFLATGTTLGSSGKIVKPSPAAAWGDAGRSRNRRDLHRAEAVPITAAGARVQLPPYGEQLRLPVFGPPKTGNSAEPFLPTCMHSFAMPTWKVTVVGSTSGQLRVYGEPYGDEELPESASGSSSSCASGASSTTGCKSRGFALEEAISYNTGDHATSHPGGETALDGTEVIELCRLPAAHEGCVTGIRSYFNLILSTGFDGILRFWRLERGVGRCTLTHALRQFFRLAEVYNFPLPGGCSNALDVQNAGSCESRFRLLTAHEDGSVAALTVGCRVNLDAAALQLLRNTEAPVRAGTNDMAAALEAATLAQTEENARAAAGGRAPERANDGPSSWANCLERRRKDIIRLGNEHAEDYHARSPDAPLDFVDGSLMYYDWAVPLPDAAAAPAGVAPCGVDRFHQARALFVDVIQLTIESVRVPPPVRAEHARSGAASDLAGTLASGAKLRNERAKNSFGEVVYLGNAGGNQVQRRLPTVPAGAPAQYVCCFLDAALPVVCAGGFDRRLHFWKAFSTSDGANERHWPTPASIAVEAHVTALCHDRDRHALFAGIASGVIVRLLCDSLLGATAARGSSLRRAPEDAPGCGGVANKAPRVEQLTGHSGSVEDVKLLSRGRVLVSASADGDVRVWNAETCALLCVLDSMHLGVPHAPVLQLASRFAAAYPISGATKQGSMPDGFAGQFELSEACPQSITRDQADLSTSTELDLGSVDGSAPESGSGTAVSAVPTVEATYNAIVEADLACAHARARRREDRQRLSTLMFQLIDEELAVLPRGTCNPNKADAVPFSTYTLDLPKIVAEQAAGAATTLEEEARLDHKHNTEFGREIEQDQKCESSRSSGSATTVRQVHSLPNGGVGFGGSSRRRNRKPWGCFDRARERPLPMLGSTGKQHRMYLATFTTSRSGH